MAQKNPWLAGGIMQSGSNGSIPRDVWHFLARTTSTTAIGSTFDQGVIIPETLGLPTNVIRMGPFDSLEVRFFIDTTAGTAAYRIFGLAPALNQVEGTTPTATRLIETEILNGTCGDNAGSGGSVSASDAAAFPLTEDDLWGDSPNPADTVDPTTGEFRLQIARDGSTGELGHLVVNSLGYPFLRLAYWPDATAAAMQAMYRRFRSVPT